MLLTCRKRTFMAVLQHQPRNGGMVFIFVIACEAEILGATPGYRMEVLAEGSCRNHAILLLNNRLIGEQSSLSEGCV